MDKILITGTGRAGTTFLIKLFSFLEFDTGFTRDNYASRIFANCNSGMENPYQAPHYICKSPTYIHCIKDIVSDPLVRVKYVIIPVRDYVDSAKSRAKNGDCKVAGGFWCARDVQEQVSFYNKIMADYIVHMVRHNLNTLFIDFDKMISDAKYLYDRLKPILDEKTVMYDDFLRTYNEVSLTARPQSHAQVTSAKLDSA